MHLPNALSDPQRYLDQIDRLHLKNARRNQLYERSQDGVTLAFLCLNRERVARLLAEAVGSGRYETRPAQIRSVVVNRKHRLLYEFCLSDHLVHGVVSSIINDRMEPNLSPSLYSYRKGTGWWNAVADFARYLRAHRAAHRDPKQRGLYVLRCDIHQYTDSIPVADGSPLWEQLREVLTDRANGNGLHARHWELIQNVVRPVTRSETGHAFMNIHGVPTGSPISTTLFNLYLSRLDQDLHKVPGAFYARYCDDILFAHPDPEITRQAGTRLSNRLAQLGLCTRRDKEQDVYFTGCGRPAPCGTALCWATLGGATRISFLGCAVAFDGTVSLSPKKARHLLRDIDARARRTLRSGDDTTPSIAGPIVCAAINRAFDPKQPGHFKSAALIRSVVTDRRQLKQLDYRIALIVARVLSGRQGVRAFRDVSPRTIRGRWGLVSLVFRRNAHHKSRTA